MSDDGDEDDAGPELLELTAVALKLFMRDPAPADEGYDSAIAAERQVGARMQAHSVGQTLDSSMWMWSGRLRIYSPWPRCTS